MSLKAEQSPTAIGRIWSKAVRHPRFVCEGILTVLVMALSLHINVKVIHYAEIRPAVPLNDPILGAVGPIRLTWPIFAVLWASIAVGIYCLAKNPPRLLMGLQAAALVLTLRTIGIYLLPIEPFPTIIPLADPIAIYLGTDRLVTKDLFFSGHAAVMFLIYLSVESPRMKRILLAATAFVSIGVMLQHVHYSVDVYAAPFFAYGSWRLVLLAHERFK